MYYSASYCFFIEYVALFPSKTFLSNKISGRFTCCHVLRRNEIKQIFYEICFAFSFYYVPFDFTIPKMHDTCQTTAREKQITQVIIMDAPKTFFTMCCFPPVTFCFFVDVLLRSTLAHIYQQFRLLFYFVCTMKY